MRAERGNFGRRLTAAGLSLACAAALAGGAPRTVEAKRGGVAECASIPFFSPKREVCYAFLGNTTFALYQEYRFGNNRSEHLRNLWQEHFETRFFDGPRDQIEDRVAGWTDTESLSGNKIHHEVNLAPVSPNRSAISVNHDADRATVRTRQEWDVYNRDEKSLYHEGSHIVNVTMCRGKLPGIQHILHEWFVVRKVADPDFDCIDFDKKHGIQP